MHLPTHRRSQLVRINWVDKLNLVADGPKVYSHKAVERALGGSGVEAARDALQAKLIEILTTYRKELAGGGSVGLQLPTNLRALPSLFLGLIKNVGLRKSAQIPSDLRSAALCQLSTLPLTLLMQFICKITRMHRVRHFANCANKIHHFTHW